MKLVDQTIQVNAPADLLYELLTDAEHLVRWMAATAEVDAQVGGTIRWTHANGDTCAGQFVELVPARRIVFTYGWERPDVEIPPGSTTVEITLEPRDGGTQLRLVHRGLAGPDGRRPRRRLGQLPPPPRHHRRRPRPRPRPACSTNGSPPRPSSASDDRHAHLAKPSSGRSPSPCSPDPASSGPR